MTTTGTLAFDLRPEDPRSFAEIIERATPDVAKLVAEADDSMLDLDELEYDLLDVAGQWVPSNEVLAAVYGKDFFNLLIENVPQQRWQDFLESHAEPPTASRMLFEVVREQIYEQLKPVAQQLIDERLAPETAPLGPRSRESGLTQDEA